MSDHDLNTLLDRASRTSAHTSVMVERAMQIAQWGNDHDDEHNDGALGDAAATLASQMPSVGQHIAANGGPAWPNDLKHRHRGDRRRQLVIAGALILAEIERMDREADRAAKEVERG